MSYVSLYRKYRPEVFGDVVGQEIVVRTLKNQIKNGKISHAYLFTGTRGTGKTTCAKIFARAVNCLSPIDSSPCGKCANCKNSNANYDILEIDAASNNGVDEIRDVRDMTKYAPSAGKYKVFIIDEAHMLSVNAHNALLKTLEEPPEHVIFILATTEAHKLPATILSRCQRFDFRLVSDSVLKKRISDIFKNEDRKITDDACGLIATAGAGSVRDALSIADVLLSYVGDEIKYSDVAEVLGANSPDTVIKLATSIINGNIGDMLSALDFATKDGRSIALLANELSRTIGNILFAKNCENAMNALQIPQEIFIKYQNIAENTDNARLSYVIGALSGTEQALRGSINPKLVLECACLRATNPKASLSTDALLERVREIENKIDSGITMLGSVGEKNASATNENANDVFARGVLGYMIKSLRTKKMFSTYSALAVEANKVSFNAGVLKILVPNSTDYKLLAGRDALVALEQTANQGSSKVVKVEVIFDNAQKSKEQTLSDASEKAKDALNKLV